MSLAAFFLGPFMCEKHPAEELPCQSCEDDRLVSLVKRAIREMEGERQPATETDERRSS